MAKLILSLDNTFLGEYPLDREHITIGRRPTNDICLDNLAISGEHAAILKIGNDFYVVDLGSTNGTLVDAETVERHLLQDADIIELGKYQLKYINEDSLSNEGAGNAAHGFENTVMIRPSEIKAMEQKPVQAAAVTSTSIPLTETPAIPASVTASNNTVALTGRIQVLNGSSIGRELVLNKALTTLGKIGVQVAVITKRPNGYFIAHVEGKVFPIVNGVSTGTQAYALSDHAIVELAGVKMEFYLAES